MTSFNQPNHTQEGPDGWTVVGEDTFCEDRQPQFKGCNISSSQQGTATAEHKLPGLTNHKLEHAEHCHKMPFDAARIKAQDSDPAESIAAGPTFSTRPFSDFSTDDMEPRQLTSASLHAYSVPVWECDVQAWVNGEPCCWRLPAGDGRANILPMTRDMTGHSGSFGSSGFILVPGQLPRAEDDIQGIGTWADFTYNVELEI